MKQNENIFTKECKIQKKDPSKTSSFELDKNGSEEWKKFRKVKKYNEIVLDSNHFTVNFV